MYAVSSRLGLFAMTTPVSGRETESPGEAMAEGSTKDGSRGMRVQVNQTSVGTWSSAQGNRVVRWRE